MQQDPHKGHQSVMRQSNPLPGGESINDASTPTVTAEQHGNSARVLQRRPAHRLKVNGELRKLGVACRV